MAFGFRVSDELQETLEKLFKKDRKRYEATLKKMHEIISRDDLTIDFYKNLRHGLSDQKRVHVDKSFVLLFKVDKKEHFVLFKKLGHHDEIYAP